MSGSRRQCPRISIHAPPRGATGTGAIPPRRWLFQFTPLREGRRCASTVMAHGTVISIHAPPRGATQGRTTGRLGNPNFNSRPSARGDERHSRSVPAAADFNSRPSARGDMDVDRDSAGNLFQFTPLREGRRSFDPSRQWSGRFQFTPLREGRPGLLAVGRAGVISIHAPPRGATAKDMQFLQIFCSTLTNQHGLTIVPRNLSRLFW